MRKRLLPHPSLQAEIDIFLATMALDSPPEGTRHHNHILDTINSLKDVRLNNLLLFHFPELQWLAPYYNHKNTITTEDCSWLIANFPRFSTKIIYELIKRNLVGTDKVERLMRLKRTRHAACMAASCNEIAPSLSDEGVDNLITFIKELLNSNKDPYGPRSEALINLLESRALNETQLERVIPNCLGYLCFLRPLLKQTNLNPKMLHWMLNLVASGAYGSRYRKDRLQAIKDRLADMALIMYDLGITRAPFPIR